MPAHTSEIAATSVNDNLPSSCNLLSSRSSEQLMAEYQATRCEDLFEQLYARYYKIVHDFITNFLGNYHDAEEVAQLVFLRVYQRPQSYRPGRKVHPWLMGIAHNEAVDFHDLRNARKRRDEDTKTFSLTCTSSDGSGGLFAAELPDQRESMPDEEAALREIHSELQQCVADLRECDRNVIQLVYLEGMSRQQAAENLGVSEGAVSNRNRRGLSSLRNMLGETNEVYEEKEPESKRTA